MYFVYGLQKSGISITKLLEKKNVEHKIWDDSKKVRSKLKSLSYTNQEVNSIWLLIHMMDWREVILDLPSFKKLQDNSKLTISQIKQWAKTHSDKNILKLWNYKLSVTSKDALAKGLKGKDIGNYIKDEEEKLFLSS